MSKVSKNLNTSLPDPKQNFRKVAREVEGEYT
jgi:hypothetical protein